MALSFKPWNPLFQLASISDRVAWSCLIINVFNRTVYCNKIQYNVVNGQVWGQSSHKAPIINSFVHAAVKASGDNPCPIWLLTYNYMGNYNRRGLRRDKPMKNMK